MNEIKHTPGPWPIERYNNVIVSIGPIVPEGYAGDVWLNVSKGDALATSAAPDLLMALELIAADADAGNSRLTSGVRMALDAALIKAGRKAEPEPVRHITINGGGL